MNVATRWATERDVPFLAEIVLLASRSHLPKGVWDHALPDDDVRRRFLERLLVTGTASWCHWSKFRVAEVDGVPAAALSGYADDEPDMLSEDAAMTEAFGHVGIGPERQEAVFERIAPFLTCLMPPIGTPWIIEWVATLPPYRRRGLVDRLLREMLDEGRRRGRRRGQIMVIAGNVSAERAYERVGFLLHEARYTRAFEEFIGAPGLHRMTQRLA
ncbi:MAG TPA: GNAT family N-acetyltransferase [Candidatus Limnocylindria bacterium]|nr:GNAT family N-acetyltransferase [Candidatus Limnocylindria bacterium]